MIDQFSNMNLRIYSFLERKSNSTWSIEPGIGKYNNLTYVVTGNLIYIINGIEYIIEKGSILYIPKGCLKEGYTVGNETFRCYTTLFLYEFFDEEYSILLSQL